MDDRFFCLSSQPLDRLTSFSIHSYISTRYTRQFRLLCAQCKLDFQNVTWLDDGFFYFSSQPFDRLTRFLVHRYISTRYTSSFSFLCDWCRLDLQSVVWLVNGFLDFSLQPFDRLTSFFVRKYISTRYTSCFILAVQDGLSNCHVIGRQVFITFLRNHLNNRLCFRCTTAWTTGGF